LDSAREFSARPRRTLGALGDFSIGLARAKLAPPASDKSGRGREESKEESGADDARSARPRSCSAQLFPNPHAIRSSARCRASA